MKLDKIINSNVANNIEKIVIDNLPINGEEKAILQRRINKLKRDPKNFIKDSYAKNKQQVRQYIPIRYTGNFQYTVVSAVYNVEKYLDDYFKNLVNQSLDFKKHIHLILVDDGSTDNSAQIIKKWQKKYPKNIHYYYKANGGQASARNLGLGHVKTEWVTFIDPDDFVDGDYFYKVDLFIQENQQLSLVGCPIKFYFEKDNIIKDTHPLKYRFTKGNIILSIKDLKNHLQLSASTAFFQSKELRSKQIAFDERMKPSFEDAKFVTNYILRTSQDREVGFIADVSYFYRKREDGSSTLDGSWDNPLLFSKVLSDGCIAILKEAKERFGSVPPHIQRIALYHVAWYFGRIVNKPSSLSHLTEEQKDIFFNLLEKIFTYIDEKIILSFNLAGVWFLQKVAWLGLFKNSKNFQQITYIDKYDLNKNQVLVYYFSYFSVTSICQINNEEVIPIYKKIVDYDFINHHYLFEHRLWIPCKNLGELKVIIDGKDSKLSFLGKHYKNIDLQSVKKHFEKHNSKEKNTWLIMDRDVQADDNAEHLYRYIKENNLKSDVFFCLRKTSHDWGRLSHEGFNLLDFGSPEYEFELRKCSKIISSHIDGYITHYFKDNSLEDKDIIFLQHGITKDDLSGWLNTKKIACLVTATSNEYHSIVNDGSHYKIGKKEVALTGFPRHDTLLRNNCTDNKIILIMPTWRNHIVGNVIGFGNHRVYSESFVKTDYAKCWKSFLHNSYLYDLSIRYGYQIIFAPHKNIEIYLDLFDIPSFITVWRANELGSIQSLFQQSTFMITDYSSVAFEMGLLNKSVLYYQFDKDDVFNGKHIYEKGYFSYENDGFGPVVYDEENLLNEVETLLKNNGKPIEPYLSRIKNTFPFRDGKNCERVYQAILALDEPDDGVVNIDILAEYLQVAHDGRVWSLVISRAKIIMEHGDEIQQAWARELLLEALLQTNDFSNFCEYVEGSECTDKWHKEYSYAAGQWQTFLDASTDNNQDIDELLKRYEAYAWLGRADALTDLDKQLMHYELDLVQELMLEAWKVFASQEWQRVIQFLNASFDKGIFEAEALQRYQPQLMLARAYRKIEEFNASHQVLVAFEGHTRNNPKCRLQIAKLAYVRENYAKCATQYQRVWHMLAVDDNILCQYVESLYQLKRYDDVLAILSEYANYVEDNEILQVIYLDALTQIQAWRNIVNFISVYGDKISEKARAETLHGVILAHYRMALIDKAYQLIRKPQVDDGHDYWELVTEIALVVGDKALAEQCYRGMVAVFPNINKERNLQKLLDIQSSS